MTEKTYTQVLLQRPLEFVEGKNYLVTWIRSDHATVGKKLSIKRDGEWDDRPWTVAARYSTAKVDIVKAYENQHKKTRDVSDVDRDGDREKVTA